MQTIYISYVLICEYRVVGNQYSRLFLTSEDRLCANLRLREQSMNVMSQCQYRGFARRRRFNFGDVTMPSQKSPWRKWRNEQSMIGLSGLCAQSWYQMACKKHVWPNIVLYHMKLYTFPFVPEVIYMSCLIKAHRYKAKITHLTYICAW